MSDSVMSWYHSGNYLMVTIKLNLLEYPKLDNFDQLLLKECGQKGASIADRLLGLETIFRRMQEQQGLKS
jgi:hypothetical protein